MTKAPRTLDDLTALVSESEVETSAAPVAKEVKFIATKQISVKMEGDDYAKLRHAAQKTELSHREILLEGFNLWLKQNAAKLK